MFSPTSGDRSTSGTLQLSLEELAVNFPWGIENIFALCFRVYVLLYYSQSGQHITLLLSQRSV